MIRLMIAGLHSGGGKTTVTCALLELLKRRGLDPCAFKCGPDYIDPMFHRSVLGVESRNLDLFLAGEDTVRRLFAQSAREHGAAVCEGVMGFYDGMGGTDRASSWQVADLLDLPVLLVVRPKGASLTLAAEIRGVCAFRKRSHIAGILLNACSASLYQSLSRVLEQETGVPVLGCLPHREQAEIQSRHLGLYTAGEIRDLRERIGLLSRELEEHLDVDRLLAICTCGGSKFRPAPESRASTVPIAVARDEAFCFAYAETLEALRSAGARLLFFSPLRDETLPSGSCGLYLPGGYPELYAEALAGNEGMRRAVFQALSNRLPTVAECGGFLYLGQTLEDPQRRAWPMAGFLPGRGFGAGKAVRFGYEALTAEADSLLLRAGESVPAHEFHYWESTEPGEDLRAEKASTGKSWPCGFTGPALYAAFPHLYMAGHPEMAERFVEAARNYERRHAN